MRSLAWILGAIAMVLLAGCAASTTATLTATGAARTGSRDDPGEAGPGRDAGTVTGTFVRIGGPILPDGSQAPDVPLSGTVVFTERGHSTAFRVGRTGRFAVKLPAGTYQVSGRSPSILQVQPSGVTRQVPCSHPMTARVSAHRTTRIAVTCIVP